MYGEIIDYLKRQFPNIAGLFRFHEDKQIFNINLLEVTYSYWKTMFDIENLPYSLTEPMQHAAELNALFAVELTPVGGHGEFANQYPLIARYSGVGEFCRPIIINGVQIAFASRGVDSLNTLEQFLGEIETKHKSTALAATLPWLIAREIFELFF
jgi:hypothetical protein